MAALPTDFGARVRAARAYVGYSQKEFAKAISVSPGTIKNYEGGTTPDERAAPETIRRLVKASRLPEWFFTTPSLQGMRPGVRDGTAEQRLSQIEDRLSALALETEARDLEVLRLLVAERQPSEGSAPTEQRP